MATSGLALILALGAFLGYEVISYRQAMVRQVQVLGNLVESQATLSLVFEDSGEGRKALGLLASQPDVLWASLYKEPTEPLATLGAEDGFGFQPDGPKDPNQMLQVWSLDTFTKLAITDGALIVGGAKLVEFLSQGAASLSF